MWKWLIAACMVLSAPIAAETKVLALSGSTRSGSYNKMLVKEAAEIARQLGAKVTVVDLRDYPMPFYDEDLEVKSGMPENAKSLRHQWLSSDKIIIASPEYNSSLSAVLKNTIDWVTRTPEGQGTREAFVNKKFAIMSASPGKSGGARGLVHLRTIIEHIGGQVVPKQVTIPDASSAFDDQGKLVEPFLKQELRQEIEQLLQK